MLSMDQPASVRLQSIDLPDRAGGFGCHLPKTKEKATSFDGLGIEHHVQTAWPLQQDLFGAALIEGGWL
jgi:hypothetical protein